MKKASDEFSNNSLAFKQVLKLLDYQLKSIEKIGANPNLISVYRRLLKHLRTLKSNQIDAILETRATSREQQRESDESDEQLLKLNLDEIRVLVQSEDASRKYLEKIATTRFGMTKGELSSIPNKNLLVEQLMTLINNEKAHQSIKRMASSKERDSENR
jgi:pyruvate formate-lyase activating enzyme-like uncharacterized protein